MVKVTSLALLSCALAACGAGNDAPIDAGRDDASCDFGAPLPVPERANVSYDLHAQDRTNCVFAAGAHTSDTIGPNAPRSDKVKHIIVVTMENHSFDNYYSDLPFVGVTDVDVAPPASSNPDALAGNAAVHRFHDKRVCVENTYHDWWSSHQEWDNGKMDGFVNTNNPGGARAMGYYDEAELPFYYWLARTFTISDRYFASLIGPTFPNRYFSVAATAWGRTETSADLDQLPPDISETQNIWYLSQQHGHSFQIYHAGFAAFANIFGTPYNGVGASQFDTDVAADTLADLIFVEPALYGANENDEHPPTNVQLGQEYVAHIIQTVMSNPKVWQSSIIFVNYDEHGGLWDHVAPPAACKPDDLEPPGPPKYDIQYHYDHLGVRVPLLVISPFSRAHYVSHIVADHTSVLRFIEHYYDLPAMTARDANAWPLLDLFDFDDPPFMTPPTVPDCVQTQPTQAGIDFCTANPNGGDGMP